MAPNVRVAIVALRASSLPSPEELCRAFQQEWPDEAQPSLGQAASDGAVVALELANTSLSATLVDAPVPWPELEPMCRAALHWPEAEASLKEHVAHLLVSASSGEQDPIGLMLSLTRMVAACALTTQPAGIYWGGGSVVNSVDSFLDDVREMSREYLPLHQWLRFGLKRDRGNSVTLWTLGMDQLGFMEVEFPRSRLDVETLVERAFDVAHHLLDNGPVLQDHDTIGLTPHDRFLVRHNPSQVDPARQVYSLSKAKR